MAINNDIGAKIKTLRDIRSVSQEELCQRASMTLAQLQGIESGAAPASLTPLLKIARGLGVRLGTFLDDSDCNGPVISKGGTSTLHFAGNCDKNGLDFHALAANKHDRNMEPFIIDVHPPVTDNFELSSHEGEEFIYVLSGSLELIYGKEKYYIKEGESIYYDSIVPHHLHSVANVESRILAVIYAPH